MTAAIIPPKPKHWLTAVPLWPDETILVCPQCSYVRAYALRLDGELDTDRSVLVCEGDGRFAHAWQKNTGEPR